MISPSDSAGTGEEPAERIARGLQECAPIFASIETKTDAYEAMLKRILGRMSAAQMQQLGGYPNPRETERVQERCDGLLHHAQTRVLSPSRGDMQMWRNVAEGIFPEDDNRKLNNFGQMAANCWRYSANEDLGKWLDENDSEYALLMALGQEIENLWYEQGRIFKAHNIHRDVLIESRVNLPLFIEQLTRIASESPEDGLLQDCIKFAIRSLREAESEREKGNHAARMAEQRLALRELNTILARLDSSSLSHAQINAMCDILIAHQAMEQESRKGLFGR